MVATLALALSMLDVGLGVSGGVGVSGGISTGLSAECPGDWVLGLSGGVGVSGGTSTGVVAVDLVGAHPLEDGV